MYRGFGYKVTYVSLEMTEKELMERLLAMSTKTSAKRIRTGGLSAREQEIVLEKFRTEFHETSNGRYRFFSPKGDYDIEQLFALVQSQETDVLFLDYLGLLRPSSVGKNMTEEYQLRYATRVAKRIAEKMGCAIVLLAQLNDEGQIMYSKGIGHHVHYWLKWFGRAEDWERGYVTMEMGKSRNSKSQDLYMAADMDMLLMENITDPTVIGAPAVEPPQKKPGEGDSRGHRGPPAPPRAPIAKIPLYENAM
jgi:predicted ATP-dependent serine protease